MSKAPRRPESSCVIVDVMRKKANPIPFSDALAVIDTPKGRAMLKEFLVNEPFPHFEQHPRVRGALIRIDRDGTRTAGRFIDREFIPLKDKTPRSLGK